MVTVGPTLNSNNSALWMPYEAKEFYQNGKLKSTKKLKVLCNVHICESL
jgi:hypothetical protein